MYASYIRPAANSNKMATMITNCLNVRFIKRPGNGNRSHLAGLLSSVMVCLASNFQESVELSTRYE